MQIEVEMTTLYCTYSKFALAFQSIWSASSNLPHSTIDALLTPYA